MGIAAFFVVLANSTYCSSADSPVEKTTGVRPDQTVVLTAIDSGKLYHGITSVR
jgi:hypothetical protein